MLGLLRALRIWRAVLTLLLLCESLRLFFGWKGNLTARSAPLAAAVAMLVPGVLGVLFFLLWQVSLYNAFQLVFSVEL